MLRAEKLIEEDERALVRLESGVYCDDGDVY